MNVLPELLEKYIISEYLGERDSLSRLKCVSRRYDYITYHKTNHVKCNDCGWFIKNFPRNHDCNVPNCMLIKNVRHKRDSHGTLMGCHFRGCKLGIVCK